MELPHPNFGLEHAERDTQTAERYTRRSELYARRWKLYARRWKLNARRWKLNARHAERYSASATGLVRVYAKRGHARAAYRRHAVGLICVVWS